MSQEWLKKKEQTFVEPQRESDGAYILYAPWNKGHAQLIKKIKNVCQNAQLSCSALNVFANMALLKRFSIENDEELPAVIIVFNGHSEKYPRADTQLLALEKRVQYK